MDRIRSELSISIKDGTPQRFVPDQYVVLTVQHLVRDLDMENKNEAARFLGEGMTFKAKLIGILEVNEARGDKMCQDALNDLKTAIRAAGEHKQRITISIAIDGLRLRDEKTGDCLYHHPVHKISFIAQDMSDSRAFGYIFGSPDTGHRFFGIKTDKTASQVVISMRDLFQVVFELKKKEIEMAKHHIEQRQMRYGATLTADTSHHLKNDYDTEKVKGKHQQLIKIRYITSKPAEPTVPIHKPSASEAIADLLDLEHELNSIQQGINQMDRITPSDPFGPLARPDPFSDIFEDPFTTKLETVPEMKPPLQMPPPPPCTKTRAVSQSESPTDLDKQSKIFDGASGLPPTKTTYMPQFPPAAKTEETHWFDQETESLFNEGITVSNTEPTSSPITFPTQEKYDTEQGPEEKNPLKPDVFMELDPLGSGWVKPYVDKKDFFQDLKNPQKKVLKELLPDYSNDNSQGYLVPMEAAKATEPAAVQEQSPVRSVLSSAPSNTLFQAPKESANGAKYSKLDPFDDTDPFEKTDPFSDKNYPTEIPSLFNDKSFEGVFPEATTFENVSKEEDTPFSSSSIHGPLRVSLPPEKSDTNTPISLSSITSRFRYSPSPPDTIRRKNYQALRHYMDERIEETLKSPPGDDDFYYTTIPAIPVTYSPKTLGRKTYSSKKYWDDGFGKAPSPPPKPALFSIKPPPLPPKKQPQSKPPARPPSLEDRHIQYDTLKDDSCRVKEPGKSSGKKYKRLVTKPKIPLLPPPPQRKNQPEKSVEEKPPAEAKSSVMGITLYQLDNTGLENLAMTLGIPSENIYNMTLQELTTRLSAKNLTTETKQPETFQADFESNFGKPEESSFATAHPPEYDKYAAIKELIENENKTENGDTMVKKETEIIEKPKFVEDRYAALRQLSMNPQKPENLSVDFNISVEEDSSNRAENLSDGARAKALDSFTPGNSLELAAESPGTLDKEEKDGEEAAGIENGAMAKIESVEKPSDIPFAENIHEGPRDNWAAFEKLSLYDAPVLPAQADTFKDNNSPYSSDGKEDSFELRKKSSQRMRSELPWRDEDESWDDYSPKESYWSEESSHDERSHDKRRDDKYQRKASGKQIRKGKGDQWFRKSKWNEETEDEYDEWYKSHRPRGGACSKERKNEMCLLDDWYDSRNKSYDDSDRYMRWSRKKSESDDEYRRRCDSDTSDREYIWTSKRSFPEGYSSGEKKQYYLKPRDYPERCHESRSRHRKGESHKRPSSASEGKRNYEKMSEHMARGKRGAMENEQAASYHKDFRYHFPEPAHHYNSYDRRVAQGKKSSRARRGDLEQCGMEAKEKKFDVYDYYKSSWHKEDGRRSRRFHFEDDFAPSTPDKAQPRPHSPKRESSKSPRRRHRQRGGRDGFFRPDNNNESFENVGEDFRPPETYNPQDEVEKDQASKQQIFGKGHFGLLTRQESSASLRKSESINIFSRENDPFEGDDFFASTPPPGHKLNRFKTEKSKSNSNVSDTFSWKGVFGDSSFHD